jgi:ABC-type transport system involved in multi-copper enzyme maturation permease subunit
VIALIPTELRRQIGRKGSFYGAIVWVTVFALGQFIWSLTSQHDTALGILDTGTGLLIFTGILSAIVVGATAGSFDASQGTMRYLVLTGRPRWQLVLVRPIALFGTIVLITLPAILIVLLNSLTSPGEAPSATAYFDLFWGVWVGCWLFGVLSLAIGTFLNSNGVAIAVAIVLNISGLLITQLIYVNVSETLAKGFFPVVASVVIDRQAGTGEDATFTVAASSVILVAWLAALLGAAWARVQRAEY